MSTSSIRENIGKRIRALRHRQGLTMEQIAQILDITVPAVGGWERGRAFPDVARLIELVDLLDTTFDYFFAGKGAEIKPISQKYLGSVPLISGSQVADSGLSEFALKIEDESMVNSSGRLNYEPGSYVLIHSLARAESNRVVLVQLEDQTLLLRALVEDLDGQRYWRALNPNWPNRIQTASSKDQILGVVMAQITPDLPL